MNTAEAWGYEDAAFSTFASYVDCMRAWGHKFTMPPYVDNVTACIRDPVTGHYDANAFIEAVWKSGYATDPNYVDKVIQIMTSYDLYRFNSMTAEDLEQGGGDVVISGNGQFTHPCPGMTCQTSYFGEIREFEIGGHKGNDYAAPVGTPTYAAAAGTVIIAGWSDSAGNWVVIDHGGGLTTKYMHHSRILVSAGQTVEKGQQIGEVGSTGQSTGPHLHFQVEVNGVAVNPDDYYYGSGEADEEEYLSGHIAVGTGSGDPCHCVGTAFFWSGRHGRCQTSSGKRKTGRRGTSGENHGGTMDAETRDSNV